MQTAIRCAVMRGGTSKGLYFLKSDLPADIALRDEVLMAAMGSPDERQIDGMGGAHPLTSKVAVIGPSRRADADVDYLFLQIAVDKAEVGDGQTCGNILAGVGPWAIENGLVPPAGDVTPVRIRIHPLTLGKGEKWYRVPPRRCHIEFEVGEDIPIAPFLAGSASEAIAARRLTDHLTSYFFPETPCASHS